MLSWKTNDGITIALNVDSEIDFGIWKSDMDLTLAPEVLSQNT